MLPLTDDVDVYTGWSLDALLVEWPDKSEVSRVWREGHGAIVFLESKLDVTLEAWISENTEKAYRVADLKVLADEQVGRRRAVFQKTSCVSYHWNQR